MQSRGWREVMPDTIGAPSQPAAETFFDYGRWFAGNADALKRWVNFATEALKTGNELSSDTLGFFQTQIRTNMDTWQALASCRAPADLLEWQRRCVNSATAQYLEQTQKFTTWLVDLTGKFGTAG
jgi:hypothetical protein